MATCFSENLQLYDGLAGIKGTPTWRRGEGEEGAGEGEEEVRRAGEGEGTTKRGEADEEFGVGEGGKAAGLPAIGESYNSIDGVSVTIRFGGEGVREF